MDIDETELLREETEDVAEPLINLYYLIFHSYYWDAILKNLGVTEDEGKEGKIAFIHNFLTCTSTSSSIYFGQYFSPVLYELPKPVKRKITKKDILTKLFEEVSKEWSFMCNIKNAININIAGTPVQFHWRNYSFF